MLTKAESPATTRSTINRPAALAAALLAGYALVRAYWQLGHLPDDLSPGSRESDLIAFTGWASVGLCLVGAAVAAGFTRPARSPLAKRLLPAVGAVTGLALVASAAMFLLDVMATIFPGIGLDFLPIGALSRLVAVASGGLLVAASITYFFDVRGACRRCGRTTADSGRLHETPMWAYVAAYVAVAGCAVRIVAQAAVGLDESPLNSGASVIAFEAAFLLAGSLLPLSLVHAWGRTWPRWVPFVARRRIPRWLVLGPGAGVGAAIVVYFGLMLLTMVADRLQGRNPFPATGGLELPEIFFWFAVPGYLVWGCGMAAGAVVYFLRTRPACRRCGR